MNIGSCGTSASFTYTHYSGNKFFMENIYLIFYSSRLLEQSTTQSKPVDHIYIWSRATKQAS